MSVSSSYLVNGMTCSHCVAAVRDEVGAIEGVTSVTVDLKTNEPSSVTVISNAPLSMDAVSAAVDEAGYALITTSG